MNLFKFVILGIPLLIAGCLPQKQAVTITDAYSFATPKDFPAAAVFMTVRNTTEAGDRMIKFTADEVSGRTELHTMKMSNNIMRMRRVNEFNIAPNGGTITLKPMSDHVMLFDLKKDMTAGETFEGVAIFEDAGEIPVTVRIRDRDEMKNFMQ